MFWPQGVLIRVSGQPPRTFTWQGQPHAVSAIVEQWRVEVGWWGEPQRRDYYRLITRDGWLVLLFHDLLSGGWYLQRLYD